MKAGDDKLDGIEGKGMLELYAMKLVTGGVYFPIPWLFEPAKHQEDRTDYCLYCSFLH